MKCKDCVFYSGIKCHGHGDYWGTCGLIEFFICSNRLSFDDYGAWIDVCYDDTKCKFTDILKLSK